MKIKKMANIDVPIEEEVDFSIVKLQLNKYELDDGSILRVCDLPNKIYRIKPKTPQGIPEYLILWKPNTSALIRPEQRGPPSNSPFDPNIDPKSPIDFELLREPFNFYELSDGTRLKVRLVLERVFKAEKRNPWGEPIYWVNKRILVEVNPNSIKID